MGTARLTRVRCTKGLLFGGPHYERHGELPCVHHAFCHAKVLAQVLDEGPAPLTHADIPSDRTEGIRQYPEIGVIRLSRGDWRLTDCAGDFEYMKGGHASGGTVTLLWNRRYGPVIAAACTDYTLREPHNQQLTRQKKLQGPLHPRIEITKDGVCYSQAYDFGARMRASQRGGQDSISVTGQLCDAAHRPPQTPCPFCLTYTLDSRGLQIQGHISGADARDARFVLPVILASDRSVSLQANTAVVSGSLRIEADAEITYRGLVFSLAPGFEAAELVLVPDESGAFCCFITVL